MKEGFLEKYINQWEKDAEFQTERILLDLNNQICQYMKKNGISRAELAERLGVSRAYVTGMLNGKPNLTVASLVKIASALDLRLKIGLQAESRSGECHLEGSRLHVEMLVTIVNSQLGSKRKFQRGVDAIFGMEAVSDVIESAA